MVTHSENATMDQTVQAHNAGAIAKLYVLEKIAQAQCLGSIHRLNIQAQYLIFLVLEKIAQAQCSSSFFRLNAPDLSGIL